MSMDQGRASIALRVMQKKIGEMLTETIQVRIDNELLRARLTELDPDWEKKAKAAVAPHRVRQPRTIGKPRKKDKPS